MNKYLKKRNENNNTKALQCTCMCGKIENKKTSEHDILIIIKIKRYNVGVIHIPISPINSNNRKVLMVTNDCSIARTAPRCCLF